MTKAIFKLIVIMLVLIGLTAPNANSQDYQTIRENGITVDYLMMLLDYSSESNAEIRSVIEIMINAEVYIDGTQYHSSFRFYSATTYYNGKEDDIHFNEFKGFSGNEFVSDIPITEYGIKSFLSHDGLEVRTINLISRILMRIIEGRV